MKRQIIRKKEPKSSRQSKKAFNRIIASKARKERRRKKESGFFTSAIFSSLFYSVEVEKFCEANNMYKWEIKNPKRVIRIDEDVSLFDNPEKVLKILLDLLHGAKTSRSYPNLHLASRISFGALYIVDNMCWEIAQKRKWEILLTNMDENDRKILSKLRSFTSSEYDEEHAYMINEKVFINRSGGGMSNQQYRVKSKEITDMIQRAVRENSNPDFELSHDAYQAISSTIGEHFDNIIQHVPDANHGYLCGFYNKQLKEVVILIFNFGKSISETIASAQLPEKVKQEISSVIENHKKKKILGFLDREFTEKNALTLLAIQEGISSRIKYDESRGHGIMDFIEHCFNLNKRCKIAIISGDTSIKIDDKYKIESKFFIDRKRRIIAFNSENDLYKKPDKNYVKNLPYVFPGVIIETRIPLEIHGDDTI